MSQTLTSKISPIPRPVTRRHATVSSCVSLFFSTPWSRSLSLSFSLMYSLSFPFSRCRVCMISGNLRSRGLTAQGRSSPLILAPRPFVSVGLFSSPPSLLPLAPRRLLYLARVYMGERERAVSFSRSWARLRARLVHSFFIGDSGVCVFPLSDVSTRVCISVRMCSRG